jgi:hypothetical protein
MKWLGIAAALFLMSPLISHEPQLSCERKFGQKTWRGMVFYRYRLRAEHFPPKQTFQLIVKSFNGIQTEAFKYSSNARGHLILQPLKDVQGTIYAICPVKRGERLTFLMRSDEDNEVYETDVVPFPLGMKSKKGIQLTLELQGEQGEKFLLFAQGFTPNEEVSAFLQVEGHAIDLRSKVTRLGDLCAPILLPASSHSGGEAKLVIKRTSEEVVFPFQWGTPALECVGACCFEIK